MALLFARNSATLAKGQWRFCLSNPYN